MSTCLNCQRLLIADIPTPICDGCRNIECRYFNPHLKPIKSKRVIKVRTDEKGNQYIER